MNNNLMLPLEDYEVQTAYNPAMHALDIYFVRRGPTGYVTILQQPETPWIEITQTPNQALTPVKPTLQLDAHLVQRLADALAKQGIRPESDFKMAGELEATKKHLDDMRRLVFEKGGDGE